MTNGLSMFVPLELRIFQLTMLGTGEVKGGVATVRILERTDCGMGKSNLLIRFWKRRWVKVGLQVLRM